MDRITSHHFRKPLACPWCGNKTDQVSGFTNNRPPAGEGFICECGRVSIFLGTNELRKPTYDEFIQLITTRPALRLLLLAYRHWEMMGKPPL